MAEIIRTIFQLRRGYESAWFKNNPILAVGEPGFVIDKNLLKIGDGVTPWRDLPFIEGQSDGVGVINADTLSDFPTLGNINIIYKA